MNLENIGNYLKKLRSEKGITQQELADLIHISRESISKWERGNSLPTPDKLLLIRMN